MRISNSLIENYKSPILVYTQSIELLEAYTNQTLGYPIEGCTPKHDHRSNGKSKKGNT